MGGVAILQLSQSWRKNNIKISNVQVGENNICKIQLFQCTVRATGVWPVLYKPTVILFSDKSSNICQILVKYSYAGLFKPSLILCIFFDKYWVNIKLCHWFLKVSKYSNICQIFIASSSQTNPNTIFWKIFWARCLWTLMKQTFLDDSTENVVRIITFCLLLELAFSLYIILVLWWGETTS